MDTQSRSGHVLVASDKTIRRNPELIGNVLSDASTSFSTLS